MRSHHTVSGCDQSLRLEACKCFDQGEEKGRISGKVVNSKLSLQPPTACRSLLFVFK